MPLSENFYNQFAEYRNSIKHTAIPIKKTYDEMLQFLESDGNQHQRDTVDMSIFRSPLHFPQISKFGMASRLI